jgi:FkbM family methyltransferase
MNRIDQLFCVVIGCNVGNYTTELNTCFPEAHIFTFEPSQTNITKLQSRFDGRDQFHIVPFAVSDFQDDAVLHSDVPGSDLSSLTKRDLDHICLDFETSEEIKTIMFQEFWKTEMGRRDIDI